MTAADDERTRRFDTLFKERSPDVIAYCRWRARSQSDAQDAVAEVFLTAWRRLDDVPAGDAARIWALRHGAARDGKPAALQRPAHAAARASQVAARQHGRRRSVEPAAPAGSE
jgi:hypothetical protein